MISDALKTVVKDEGWKALYKGLVPGLFLVRFGIVIFRLSLAIQIGIVLHISA